MKGPSKPTLEIAFQNFILAHPEYMVYTTSKKEETLVYNLNFDCISNVHDISKTKMMVCNLMKNGNLLTVMKFFTLRWKSKTD